MSANPKQLWPPNNKMNEVTIRYNSTDNCPGATNCVLSVSSDEPAESIDFIVLDAHRLRLRAKRTGSGDGRTYTVTTRCTDQAGNVSTSSTTVTVPHDMSGKQKNIMADNGRKPAEEISLKIASNPTSTYFGVDIESFDKATNMNVKLIDVSGNIVEVQNNLKAGQFIKIGQSARPGIYLLQISQGKLLKQVTLIKQ
jgi:hypothetical protein